MSAFVALQTPIPSHSSSDRTTVSWRAGRVGIVLTLALLLAGMTAIARPEVTAAVAPDLPGAPEQVGTSLIPGVAEVDIDAFWGARFAEAGFWYGTPGVIAFDGAVATGCGTVQPSAYLSFYCTTDQTVYYSTTRFNRVYRTYGDAAWINIMAHEWGHHVQQQLGLNSAWRVANDLQGIELEATCLEGVYVANAFARELLDAETIATMTRMFRGDDEHGTREQLQGAFDAGYGTGLTGCGVSLPGANTGVPAVDVAAAAPAAVAPSETGRVESGQEVRVTTAAVNLRSAPSTAAPVNNVLTLGGTVRVTGPAEDGGSHVWLPVVDEATGTAGYVAAEFLSE